MKIVLWPLLARPHHYVLDLFLAGIYSIYVVILLFVTLIQYRNECIVQLEPSPEFEAIVSIVKYLLGFRQVYPISIFGVIVIMLKVPRIRNKYIISAPTTYNRLGNENQTNDRFQCFIQHCSKRILKKVCRFQVALSITRLINLRPRLLTDDYKLATLRKSVNKLTI